MLRLLGLAFGCWPFCWGRGAASAFACLVDSQVIQEKAATYEGSGSQAEEEAAVAKHKAAPKAKADPLLAVQQQSEDELRAVNKQVETTDTA